MLCVVCRLLFVVWCFVCLLVGVCCLLFVVRCLVFVAGCLSCAVCVRVICCLLCVDCCFLFGVCSLVSVVRCVVFVGCCVLSAGYYLLCVVRC